MNGKRIGTGKGLFAYNLVDHCTCAHVSPTKMAAKKKTRRGGGGGGGKRVCSVAKRSEDERSTISESSENSMPSFSIEQPKLVRWIGVESPVGEDNDLNTVNLLM